MECCAASRVLVADFVKESLRQSLEFDDLTLQFLAQMRAKSTHGARLKLCFGHMKRYELLPRAPSVTKCDLLAVQTIRKGVDASASGNDNDRDALALHCEALRYATHTDTIALAYITRSALLFRLKKFRECLLDIDRILVLGCDDDLKSKLLKRKAECECARGRGKKDDKDDFDVDAARQNLFGLAEQRMDGVACASARLRIHHTPAMGRGIVATEDISPGHVLVNEEPYVSAVHGRIFTSRCYFCHKKNYSMIACGSCSYVMFCDEKCQTDAWNAGHEFECPIMPRLVAMDFTLTDLLSLRVLLKARSQSSSWGDMFESIELAEKETTPELKGFTPGSENTKIYNFDSYPPVHMLETKFTKRDIEDVAERCVTVVSILHMLKEYTSFFGDVPNAKDDILSLDEDHHIWRVGGLLLHLNMMFPLNSRQIETSERRGSKISRSPFAVGVYAFSSLLNHACSPNAGQVNNGKSLITIALRPIKKGQQIFVNYSSHFSQQPLENRLENLQKKFGFKCRCEACDNNWPMEAKLKPARFINKKNKNKYRNIINENLKQKLLSGDKKVAYHTVQDLYKFIEMLEEVRPSIDLFNHEEYIWYCWAILSNYEGSVDISYQDILAFMARLGLN